MYNITGEPRVSAFLQKHCDRWGAKIVTVLQMYPDEPVHVLQLSHLIEPPDYGMYGQKQVDRMLLETENIPQTDRITLKQVDTELNRLVKIKAYRLEAGLDCSDLDFKIEVLAAYHRATTRPNGTIKNFRSSADREYQRHQAAVKRLLAKAKKECPEAWAYLTSHLKMGMYFTWLSDDHALPVEIPSQPKTNTRNKKTIRHRRC